MPKVVALEEGGEVTMPPGKDADARKFYGQVLGLRETMRPPGQKGVWFQVEGGPFRVLPDAAHAPRGSTPLARFRVDSAEKVRAAVQRLRYRDHDAPHVVGTRGFYATDPFGNRVELRERPPA